MDIIETERLILRPFCMSDLNDFFEYAKHPDVGPNAGWETLKSVGESFSLLNEFIVKDEIWAIEEKVSGKVIGSVGLHPDKRRNHNKAREIGYVLNPLYWGKGYMTEAVKAVIRYAFEQMNLLILCSDHYPFNQRSKKVLLKCGFKYEGTLRLSCQVFTGEIYDHVCYSLTKEEYLRGL